MENNQKYLGILVLGALVVLITLILLSFALPRLSQTNSTNTNANINTNTNQGDNTGSNNQSQTVPAVSSSIPSNTNPRSNNTTSINPNTRPTQTYGAASPSNNRQPSDNQPVIGQQQVLLNLPRVGLSPTPTIEAIKPLTDALGKLFTVGSITSEHSDYGVNNTNTDIAFSPTPNIQNITALGNGSNTSNFIYYPQCDGPYDNISLPGGCNVCSSGCGPATVAMILSSYINKSFTPPAVINLYKNNNMYAGCDGTKITDAQIIMQQNGLKTTDLLILTSNTPDETLSDFKSYLQNGWTLFTLARYCANGCSHYFWITNIDNNNNVWAYDPFYGRKTLPPPFDENQYSPYPQYRAAFGVKKS